MTEDIKRAKRLLESKGYTVTKSYDLSLFDHLKSIKPTPIKESVGYDYVDVEDYSYEDDSYLYEDISTASEDELVGDQLKVWYPGAVVTTNSYSKVSGSTTGKHYVMVIDSIEDDDKEGVKKYTGFLISTQVDKSNKYNPKYPNNLYIDDVQSIFYGRNDVSPREVLIRVDDPVEFTSRDIVPQRAYKGKVSNKFWRFVANGSINYHSGKSYFNKHKYWISNNKED